MVASFCKIAASLKVGHSMAELTLQIDGMHCSSCVRRVNQALTNADGLTVKEVRIGEARIESSKEDAAGKAVEALAKAGYKAHVEAAAGN